jgi:DNA uptake protein ComE-like DNA-binding protein
MMRTRSSVLVRLAAGSAILLVSAACTKAADDAARTDTAAAAAASATSAPNVPATTPAGSLDSAAGTTTDSAARAAGASQTASAMLDPNSATKEQLVAVPGMTAAAADALIAGRPYQDMVAVNKALASLSADARKTVYAKVWKPIDLNTAKGEEILLIPGVGPRMRHEFEEYRPYKNIEQFRREMGKYVDKEEVARLEQYVAIR